MKNINCVVFFDSLGDFGDEKKVCEDCWKVWSLEHPETAKTIQWKFTNNPTQLYEFIPGANFVFFDYGGLGEMGHQSLATSFARYLEKYIIEYPSIEFILLCTMGRYWYEEDYKEEYVNLHFEEVDWHNIFDKYMICIN
jgi:hypothetical protein